MGQEWRMNQAAKKFLENRSETFYCEICYDDHPKETLASLECGHIYCRDGLKSYFDYMITHSGRAFTLKCPDKNCIEHVLVEDV